MPTENDLRAALAAIANEAPESCDSTLAVASQRHHRTIKRRNLLLPLTAAAIVGVIAAGAVTFAERTGTPSTGTRTPTVDAASPQPLPVSGSLPVTRYVFDVDLKGWSSSQVFTTSGAQQVEVASSDSATRAAVTLFAPGGWTPNRPAGAAAVSVDGSPGFYGTIRASAVDLNGEVVPGTLPTAKGTIVTLPGALAWQYQPGAWALVYAFAEQKTNAAPLRRRQALTIAEAVRPGQSHSIAVPARFVAAPAGLQLQGVLTRPSTGGSGGSALYSFGPQGTNHTTLLIGVGPATGDTPRGTPAVTVGRFRGQLITRDDLDLSDGTVNLSLGSFVDDGSGPRTPGRGEPALSLAQLRSVVADMRFAASLTDTSTWFDAATIVG